MKYTYEQVPVHSSWQLTFKPRSEPADGVHDDALTLQRVRDVSESDPVLALAVLAEEILEAAGGCPQLSTQST